jgi:hypothetical protein
MANKHWVGFGVVLSVMALPGMAAAEIRGLDPAIPVFDYQCHLDAQERAARIAFLEREVARSKDLSTRAFAQLRENTDEAAWMNGAYVFGDLTNITASLAIAFVFKESIVAAVASGSALQMSFQAVLNVLPLSYVAFFMSGGPNRIGEGHLERHFVEGLDALLERGFSIEGPARTFLGAEEGSVENFQADLPGLEALIVEATDWYEATYAERMAHEPTPIFERLHHFRGNMLGQVLIPYWRAMSQLLLYRHVYQKLLLDFMRHDAVACAARVAG